MMLGFRLHPEADAEGIEAAQYIREDDSCQAELFKEALLNALDWARSQPLIFRCFEDDFRKVKVGKFRYSLVFRIRGDEVQILAVAHMSRKPGYWKDRANSWEE
ncbi:MAG: type II toxin-antitoxin system RelE/ParE family toxin [Akkermansiaceae bacterium]